MWLFKRKEKNRGTEVTPKFTLKKSPPDGRDYLMVSAKLELPKSYTILNLPPVRNQLNIGSCMSHTAIGAVEVQLMNKTPHRFLELSELYHYYCARHYINNQGDKDSGMTIRDGCKTLDKYHGASEYAWGYDTSKFNIKPPWWVFAVSGMYKIKRYELLMTITSIKSSLIENVPVMIGIKCYDSMLKLNLDNNTYSAKGNYLGGHAVLIVGYDTDGLFIRNSWGYKWGAQGYFYMKYTDFFNHSFDWYRCLI